MDGKVKSRSIIKDDESDDDVGTLDLSNGQQMPDGESGDILKNIKRKIDEKLTNYNFPDRPTPSKTSKNKSPSDKFQKRDKIKAIRNKHKDALKHKSDKKRNHVKELMRKDYKNSFSQNKSEDHPRPKKPVIVRRHQGAPPPMNFTELLKIAEQKSKQTPVFEPLPVVKPKKLEERPMTQEELDRRRRAEEHKLKRQTEEAGGNISPAHKPVAKPTSTVAKTADQRPVDSRQGKPAGVKKEEKRPAEEPKPRKAQPPQDAGLNPFDRIYSQIHKAKPKPGMVVLD